MTTTRTRVYTPGYGHYDISEAEAEAFKNPSPRAPYRERVGALCAAVDGLIAQGRIVDYETWKAVLGAREPLSHEHRRAEVPKDDAHRVSDAAPPADDVHALAKEILRLHGVCATASVRGTLAALGRIESLAPKLARAVSTKHLETGSVIASLRAEVAAMHGLIAAACDLEHARERGKP